ncbi:MAG TPA: thrombospondin type 3 repeat-containing protein [Verrucomicrobiae bacterium]|nr:thrombospondin type 3 repeat-containing protein [Verrucomicrobiae bacterium]
MRRLDLTIAGLICLAWLGGAGIARGAAEPAKPNYKVQPDAINAAGGASFSADYGHEGSVGGIIGSSTALGGEIRIGHGYIQQRRDATNLVVTAAPALVDEGATSQLTATAIMDDESLIPLRGADVKWSATSGPVVGVDNDGVVQVGFVYQISLATIQASFLTTSRLATVTVLNVGNDDFARYAGDGLNDAWQVLHFGEDNPSALASADPDGDGYSNAAEYVTGTDPADPNSHFRLRLLPFDTPGSPLRIGISPWRADRTYVVEKREQLDSGEFVPLTQSDVALDSFERIVTDLTATNRTSFYRVRIIKP